jgi:hypothetical protein
MIEAVEQPLHFRQVRQRYTDLADLGPRHRVGGIVTALGRQIERHRQTGLALVEQKAVTLVGFFRRAEAGILAYRPQPATEAVLKDATGEGILARLVDVREIDHIRRDNYRNLDA